MKRPPPHNSKFSFNFHRFFSFWYICISSVCIKGSVGWPSGHHHITWPKNSPSRHEDWCKAIFYPILSKNFSNFWNYGWSFQMGVVSSFLKRPPPIKIGKNVQKKLMGVVSSSNYTVYTKAKFFFSRETNKNLY